MCPFSIYLYIGTPLGPKYILDGYMEPLGFFIKGLGLRAFLYSLPRPSTPALPRPPFGGRSGRHLFLVLRESPGIAGSKDRV